MTASHISQTPLKSRSAAPDMMLDMSAPHASDELNQPRRVARPLLEVVVPVHNEERVLAASVRALHAFMLAELPYTFRITIADNASTDATFVVAQELAAQLTEVEVVHLEQKGRGRALRRAWLASEADVVAYMDVDLSTDLAALPELIEPLVLVQADVAIGSRLAPGAQVKRSLRREVISRGYNILLRASLQAGFSDAQCGFKALRREVAEQLLALVQDEEWFFDTELLHQAQRHRMAIHEVPVRWVEDPDSRVRVAATIREDLRGIARLRRARREQEAQQLPGAQPAPGVPV